MPGPIRREAEFRIQQVLHQCEEKVEDEKVKANMQGNSSLEFPPLHQPFIQVR